MDASLQSLASALQQTLSPQPQVRRQAEDFLKTAQGQPGYLGLLVALLQQQGVDAVVKQAAAVALKNAVVHQWSPREDSDLAQLPESDREALKSVIIDLMLSSSPAVQKQLSHTISTIGSHDFPAKWKDFLPNLVTRMMGALQQQSPPNFAVVAGCLDCASSIFRSYREMGKTDETLRELKFDVLGHIQEPLQQILLVAFQAFQGGNHSEALMRCVYFTFDAYLSLLSVDLAEFFEDNLRQWMDVIHFFLTLPLEASTGEDESSLRGIQTILCEIVSLFMSHYEEEFDPFLGTIVEDVWKLLERGASAYISSEFDVLVSSGLRFLKSVAVGTRRQLLLGQPETLRAVCEHVVLPNLRFREEDEELFEDNPVEYIRRDIEGSDAETRRSNACDLVKGMIEHCEQEVTKVCLEYVSGLLQQAASQAAESWKAKDVAINLMIALSAKASAARHGATQVNAHVNVLDFMRENIFGELENQNAHPVLKADALKYIAVFRSHLPYDSFRSIVGGLVKLLHESNPVVQTYAAATIERLLTVRDVKDGKKVLRYSAEDLEPIQGELFGSLFGVMEGNKPKEMKENEYVVKALMRVIATMRGKIAAIMKEVVPRLANLLSEIADNPSNPMFNHYCFEAIAAVVKFVLGSDASLCNAIDELVFPVLQKILQAGIQDFTPYVFQIMSQLTESRPPNAHLPEYFTAFVGPVLTPDLWQNSGNVPGLVRFLRAVLSRDSAVIIGGDYLEGVLGVFQNLIASPQNDHEGFRLLRGLLESVPQSVAPHMGTIWQILLTRMQKKKTHKYQRNFLLFLAFISLQQNPDNVVQQIDSIQDGLFRMIIQNIAVPNFLSVTRSEEEIKLTVAGMSALIFNSAVFSQKYGNMIPEIFNQLVAAVTAFENDRGEGFGEEEEGAISMESPSGLSSAFSKLHYASSNEPHEYDRLVPVGPVQALAKSFHSFATGPRRGDAMELFKSLDADRRSQLEHFLSTSGLQL